MGFDEDLVGSAAAATGDDIVAAGRFVLTGGDDGGASSTLEGRTGRRGRRLGRPAERAATSAVPAGGPPPLVVAVSPWRVYLLRPTESPHLVLAHTFDRRRVATTIHARLSVRRVILEDTWTGERFELEGARSPHAHVTATMHALSDVDEIAS